VLIVSHGGVLRALERYCHDRDRAFPNVGGRIFELDGEAGTAGDLAITAGPRATVQRPVHQPATALHAAHATASRTTTNGHGRWATMG